MITPKRYMIKIKKNMPLKSYFDDMVGYVGAVGKIYTTAKYGCLWFTYKDVDYMVNFERGVENGLAFRVNVGDSKEVAYQEHYYHDKEDGYLSLFQNSMMHDGRMFYELLIDWDKIDKKDIEYIEIDDSEIPADVSYYN